MILSILSLIVVIFAVFVNAIKFVYICLCANVHQYLCLSGSGSPVLVVVD